MAYYDDFTEDMEVAGKLSSVWVVFIAVLIFGVGTAALTFERWAKPFQRETTYIANKESSMARDGAINRLTTLYTNYHGIEDESPARAGIGMTAMTEYNGAAHKADIPEYIVNWIEHLQPGSTSNGDAQAYLDLISPPKEE